MRVPHPNSDEKDGAAPDEPTTEVRRFSLPKTLSGLSEAAGVVPRLVKAWSSLERPRLDANRSFEKLTEERLALKTPPVSASEALPKNDDALVDDALTHNETVVHAV